MTAHIAETFELLFDNNNVAYKALQQDNVSNCCLLLRSLSQN